MSPKNPIKTKFSNTINERELKPNKGYLLKLQSWCWLLQLVQGFISHFCMTEGGKISWDLHFFQKNLSWVGKRTYLLLLPILNSFPLPRPDRRAWTSNGHRNCYKFSLFHIAWSPNSAHFPFVNFIWEVKVHSRVKPFIWMVVLTS